MMNPETLLNEAANAIEYRDISIVGSYHLCFIDGHVKCISTAQPVEKKFIVGTFRAQTMEVGLTTAQWDSLSAKIADMYAKEVTSCQDPKQ